MELVLNRSDLPALQQARRLWALSRWDEAEVAFLKAAEEFPHHLRALVDTARVLGDRGRLGEASSLLERLATLAQNEPDLQLLLGQTWRMCQREEEALKCFQRYTQGSGKKDPLGYLELAVLHERRRQIADAEKATNQALKLAPQCFEALIIRARVRQQLGQPESAIAALRRVVNEPRAALPTKAQAWTMLGQLADRNGQHAEALQSIEKAKAILRPLGQGLAANAMTALRAWEKTCLDLKAETAESWWKASQEGPRLAHLVGFPRSGTTLLENVLDSHSQLVSSEERQVLGRDLMNILWREPGEFIPPSVEALSVVSDGKLGQLRHRYQLRMEELLGEGIGERVHLDKNPTHTLFLPGIIRLLPGSKIIVALRDPRDVVTSCYMQYFPLNSQSAAFLTWEEAARRYALDMGAWLHLRTVLPKESWIEIRYEDLIDDLPQQTRRILSFLALPWEDGVLNYREQVSAKAVHTPSYLDVTQPVYRRAIGRWKPYAVAMGSALATLHPFIEAFGYDA